MFPSNSNECKDSDGDGWGDNQDSDDDNDGINDITEAQEGTDPMDASSVPVESFEIRVPGTVIGLGAWDLIGIFGGVPFFSWILFCLITRGARSRKFEKLLFESKSEEEAFVVVTIQLYIHLQPSETCSALISSAYASCPSIVEAEG